MTRITMLGDPLLLGFDQIERALDRVKKASTDGYPPYNIERISARDPGCATQTHGEAGAHGDLIRIVLAVAGFTRDQLDITVEDSHLTIRGRQVDTKEQPGRTYLHRGIAARQFLRTFLLADGFEVRQANLEHGLLTIDVARPEQTRQVRRIDIKVHA